MDVAGILILHEDQMNLCVIFSQVSSDFNFTLLIKDVLVELRHANSADIRDESSCRLPLSDRSIISRDTSILVIRQVISMISTIRSTFVVTSVAES